MADERLPIVAEGDAVFQERKALKHKPRFLKANESFRGRFLSLDFKKFKQHGVFVKGNASKTIQSHACLLTADCPSCAAGVPVKFKTFVYLWDADKGEMVVRDLAKTDSLKKAIGDYGDDLLTGAYSISLSDKGELSVSLLPPAKAKDVPPTPEGIEIDYDLQAYCIGLRKPDEMRKLFAGKDLTPVAKEGETANVKIERAGDDGQALSDKF